MRFEFGPYAFVASGSVSGYAPTKLDGPNRQSYVVEHQIPSREGGVMEYLGSEQSRYSLKGFVSPPMDGPFNGTAAAVLSGSAYVAVNADDAKNFLTSLRGSGAQLLRIESTSSNQSGYMNLYENGFFYIEKMTFGFEAGRTYPYYPYGIDLHGASVRTFGNSSGTSTFAPTDKYLSGYVHDSELLATSGAPNVVALVVALGVRILTVASGNLKVAVYSGNVVAGGIAAQSAPQAVHSGWNYFPLNPSFTTQSGILYHFALMGDAASTSGYTIAMNDTATSVYSYQSGVPFSSGFPSPLVANAIVSGYSLDIVMVTA